MRISYDEVLRLPSETKTVTLECAGNGRVYLVPKADGVQWQLGAVGTAEWTGVPLNTLLERVAGRPGGRGIVFEGADSGEPSKPSKPAQADIVSREAFRSRKARNGGMLLAYKMNGQPLPTAHGFPFRAIVPGWYGMASVKWLTRIVAAKAAVSRIFSNGRLCLLATSRWISNRVPVTEMQVKSQIARPTIAEVIQKGNRLIGYLAPLGPGHAPISKVEISTDGGKRLRGQRSYLANRSSTPGDCGIPNGMLPPNRNYTLMAKATDAKGNTQPSNATRIAKPI